MKRIIECVPNFSEGRDMTVIKQITNAISSVEGVSVLNVDPGEATNRTVVTFVGEPEAVCEAAFRGARRAAEVIDMRQHHGTHPRIGATDVLPIIPVAGISLEECALLARQLAARMAREAGIPCYAYEASALKPERKNLAVCRAGEYEALEEKLTKEELRPDYCPNSLTHNSLTPDPSPTGEGRSLTPDPSPTGEGSNYNIPEEVRRCGISVVGARDFLIAVNFNLNTTDRHVAHAIACDVREKGRPGKPGTLKCTKAIGWYIEEYGIAQVSMNMTNIHVTPLHVAFKEVSRCAQNRGVSVTGTEIIGLVPKSTLVDAGKYFLEEQHLPMDIPEDEIINVAVKAMHLDDLRPFDVRKKVIEYLLEETSTAETPTEL